MNTILFDLDGTLLPMDQDAFIQLYFQNLVVHFAPLGYHANEIINAVNTGTKAMVLNDGSLTNEERFWKTFADTLGQKGRELEEEFLDFYAKEFSKSKAATSFQPLTLECLRILTQKGYQIVIATNPIFPKIATHGRIQWAGFSPDDVSYITTYENSSYCKPNLDYYREILANIDKSPEECLMVGNDVNEDMCTRELGMDCYLITDCLINTMNKDINQFKHGSMEDFRKFVDSLPDINMYTR